MTVQRGLLAGLVAHLVVLTALAGAGAVGGVGALAALAYGAGTVALLGRALAGSRALGVGPADLVTLLRSALVGGVAALVADSVTGPVPVGTLVALAGVALALDAVDGRVARRTGTVTATGARFDMEVDSVLVLLLGVYVAGSLGPWVLAVAAVHYVFVAARWVLPWLRGQVPPRHWCKVVAAVQGMVLVTVAAGVLPRVVAVGALVAVAGLLAESFGREVWLLWRSRRTSTAGDVEPRAVGSVHG
ncbi:CDP-alcohol phosphatidyltransferase family protein [Modestobacter marinus]|uniref:CDP-alcohol phosphatidyltransferase family protein n=1 Tax=Modestobacter marinus TaxID=477641 RepID=UPI001C9590B3|nr:CDP-alcohol phosphatidyltransferase family protein [Modestobacter marinus]